MPRSFTNNNLTNKNLFKLMPRSFTNNNLTNKNLFKLVPRDVLVEGS